MARAKIGTATVTESRGVKLPGAKRKRKTRNAILTVPLRWSVELWPSCRVVTEANTHEGWRSRWRRAKEQSLSVVDVWAATGLAAGVIDDFYPWQAEPRGLVVTMTHFGPRMDGDNLAGAFKAVRDAVAKLIGIDDGSAAIDWRYSQHLGPPGVCIRIEPRKD